MRATCFGAILWNPHVLCEPLQLFRSSAGAAMGSGLCAIAAKRTGRETIAETKREYNALGLVMMI